jgi:excisionase family DNA binding protein
MSVQQERLHQISSACERIGVGRSTLYELIRTGELPSVKVRGRRLISEAAINEFIAGLSTVSGAA